MLHRPGVHPPSRLLVVRRDQPAVFDALRQNADRWPAARRDDVPPPIRWTRTPTASRRTVLLRLDSLPFLLALLAVAALAVVLWWPT